MSEKAKAAESNKEYEWMDSEDDQSTILQIDL